MDFQYKLIDFFLFLSGFLVPKIYESQDSWGKERPILIFFYHFHPLHDYLGSGESLLLHIASDWSETLNL